MPSPLDPNLVALAEEYRHLLPPGFAQEVDEVGAVFNQGKPIVSLQARGPAKADSNQGICAAILREMSLLLCTEHPRYQDLRIQGDKLSKDSILVIAGWTAAAAGISTGVATACVSLLALTCLRVGVGAFCRLNPPPAPDVKKATKRKAAKKQSR